MRQGGLLVTAGYYGSIYTNANGHLDPTVPGTLNNPLGVAQTPFDAGLRTTLGLPFALPPDSQAHQVYVSGDYRFTPTTVVNFKYAHTHATQNEDFAGNGFTPLLAGQSNLGGEINTTIAQFGVTSRPMPKLSLLANVRYEDKENKTPIALYNIEGGETTGSRTAIPRRRGSRPRSKAATCCPTNIRATLGLRLGKRESRRVHADRQRRGALGVEAEDEGDGLPGRAAAQHVRGAHRLDLLRAQQPGEAIRRGSSP